MSTRLNFWNGAAARWRASNGPSRSSSASCLKPRQEKFRNLSFGSRLRCDTQPKCWPRAATRNKATSNKKPPVFRWLFCHGNLFCPSNKCLPSFSASQGIVAARLAIGFLARWFAVGVAGWSVRCCTICFTILLAARCRFGAGRRFSKRVGTKIFVR